MRVWRRRVVTVAVAGLLLVGGCTAAPRGAPPVDPVAPMVGAAPVRVPLPAAPRGWSAGRVLGVVWRGAAGAESAELGWLDALSLRPAGLRVVDTRTWTAVTVHADAGSARGR